jgi:hypothetical protein
MGSKDVMLSTHFYSFGFHAMGRNFFISSATTPFNFFEDNAPQLTLWEYADAQHTEVTYIGTRDTNT